MISGNVPDYIFNDGNIDTTKKGIRAWKYDSLNLAEKLYAKLFGLTVKIKDGGGNDQLYLVSRSSMSKFKKANPEISKGSFFNKTILKTKH